jgi:antitoxin component YwqK of YwqJK toxin-antitoxin module
MPPTRARILPPLLLGALLIAGAAPAPRAGEGPSFEVAEPGREGDAAASEKVLEARPEELPPLLRRYLRPYLQERPEVQRLRVVVAQYYRSGEEDFYPYARSVVPLDEENRPHGTEIRYTNPPRRQRLAMAEWSHGVKHGQEVVFSGESRTVIPWVKGEVHGWRRTYDAEETLRAETRYVRGVAHGPRRSYDAEGRLLREAVMERGERHGELTEYWPGTEQPRRVVPYRHGVVHGRTREYYRNGELKRVIPFRENAMHGVERIFEPDGTLVRERVWEEGDLVSERDVAGKEEG